MNIQLMHNPTTDVYAITIECDTPLGLNPTFLIYHKELTRKEYEWFFNALKSDHCVKDLNVLNKMDNGCSVAIIKEKYTANF